VYSFAASEFAGELGLGSVSRDCREQWGVGRHVDGDGHNRTATGNQQATNLNGCQNRSDIIDRGPLVLKDVEAGERGGVNIVEAR
jgi:hypothetical protein